MKQSDGSKRSFAVAVATLSVVASAIAVFTFVTGIASLKDVIRYSSGIFAVVTRATTTESSSLGRIQILLQNRTATLPGIVESDQIMLTGTQVAGAGAELSWDGTKIAFDDCGRSRLQRGIYISKPDGAESQLLTPLEGDNCVTIRWAPNGTKISYSGSKDHMLHLVDVATGLDSTLNNTLHAGWHSWSPQSDRIVYEGGRGAKRRLYVLDIPEKVTRLHYAGEYSDCESWAPAWSPRGDLIAFTDCRGRLMVITTTGEPVPRLSESVGWFDAYSPRWSPDGRWLLFAGSRFSRIRQLVGLDTLTNNTIAIEFPVEVYSPFSIAPLSR